MNVCRSSLNVKLDTVLKGASWGAWVPMGISKGVDTSLAPWKVKKKTCGQAKD